MVRRYCKNSADKGLSRQEVIQILARLLFSHTVDISSPARERFCLGVMAKRTLLTHSLLGVSKTPLDIGRFVLLDVDVGGIPTMKASSYPESPQNSIIQYPVSLSYIISKGEDLTSISPAMLKRIGMVIRITCNSASDIRGGE